MRNSEFEEIVDAYGSRIYGYLLRFLTNREDAEDVLQTVFFSFYKRMESVQPENYASYLYRTAHNQAINFRKRNKRFLGLDKLWGDLESPDTVGEDTTGVTEERIKQAFRKLKPKEMQAVELQVYQKKSYKEAAEIMGITLQAVDSILVRAKKKLRKYLQDLKD